MFSTNLKRIIKAGFYNFWRNGTVSLASVMVMMVTLTVLVYTMLFGTFLDATLTELQSKIDVNVTFVPTAGEEDILNIKHSLESLPEVSLVTYVTREEALVAFKERHANDQAILAALEELGENPLGAVLNIQARNPSQYSSIAEFLESGDVLSSSGITIVDRVNYFQNKVAIDRLSTIIESGDRFGLFVTIFLIVVSVLISFNTIRLTIYISKDEISVMRLVGASTAYIQGPFIILGIIYGLVAAVLTLGLFVPITYWLGMVTGNFFIGFNVFSYYLRNFFEIAFIIVVSGVLIGALSSVLAIRKYLKI